MDFDALPEKEKGRLRKIGVGMLKELQPMFPTSTQKELADAIKKNMFNLERTVDYLLSPPVTQPPVPQHKPLPLSAYTDPKYIASANRIKDVLPSVPTSDIISLLQKFRGDEEKVTLLLLETVGDDGSFSDQVPDLAEMEEKEECFSEEDNERDFLSSSVGVDKSIEDDDLGDWDPSDIDEAFYEEDSWTFSSDDMDEGVERELCNWFMSPEEDKEHEKDRELRKEQGPDMLMKLYQEIADEEYAREFVREEQQRSGIIFSQDQHSNLLEFREKVEPNCSPQKANQKSSSFGREAVRISKPKEVVAEGPKVIPMDEKVVQFIKQVEANALLMPSVPKPQPVAPPPPRFSIATLIREVNEKLQQQCPGTPKKMPSFDCPVSQDFFQVRGEGIIEDKKDDLKQISCFFDIQENEIQELYHLLGPRVHTSPCYPFRLSIHLSPKIPFPEELLLTMFVNLPPNYPEVSPKIEIRSLEIIPQISPQTMEYFTTFMNHKARELTGDTCLSQLVEIADMWASFSPAMIEEAQFAFVNSSEPAYADCTEILKAFIEGTFESRSPKDLLREHWEKIKSTAEKLPSVLARDVVTLLRFFKWNEKELLKAFNYHMETNTLSELYFEAGILTPLLVSNEWKQKVNYLCSKMHECPGCLEEFSLQEMSTFPCCHVYCNDCLKSYVELQVSESGGSSVVSCPGYECAYELDETLVSSLLDSSVYSQYLSFVANTYANKDPQIKWCTAKGCNHAIRKTVNKGLVMCTCGHLQCWDCGGEGHWPATCEQQKWWREVYCKDDQQIQFESRDEEMSIKWLLRYTQDCPKCSSPIEKSGGCNHMSCRSCRYQYCWLCKEPWESSHYACKNSVEVEGRREGIASRIESNLTFRQMYLINTRNKADSDVTLKNTIFKFLNHKTFGSSREVEVICRSLQYIYLHRQFTIQLCIAGKYMQEHKIGGSSHFKGEVRRLSSGISYAASQMDLMTFNPKKYKKEDMELVLRGLENNLSQFVRSYANIVKNRKKD
eukprot:TRINITY_DN2313_c0_g3_i2.p1 TRINITY_DN2313_c0_g3~~TRINITY_DN2313_c0_g3_i2.p1  ORF type:complete len:1008 (+),score=204.35 TRINITY_DN2313_c0_g3_i2:29-3052(+)